MTEPEKRHRMIGSMLALIFGVVNLVSSLGRAGQGAVAGDGGVFDLVGPLMILGAIAYRSRKRRLCTLRADTDGRVAFEVASLALLTTLWLVVGPARWVQEPMLLVVPVWALVAYLCIADRRDDDARAARSAWTRGPVALAVALVLGAIGSAGLPVALQGSPDPEPRRPPQSFLDAVRPLGLAVSMGQPFAKDNEWFVAVECRLAPGEERRLTDPNAAEHWLFGVLWGDGSPPPREPRSYVQPAPKLTLALRSAGGDVQDAAWAVFDRCPHSTERQLFPLWPEDVLALVDGSASAWMRAEALGLPRDHPFVSRVRAAESFDEVAEALLAQGMASGDLFVPVDGLVNGGAVFEVRDFQRDPGLSNVPTAR